MRYTREEALERIRGFLAAHRKGDETTCQTAGRLGIFCHGYDRWTIDQLRQLYPWLAKKMLSNRKNGRRFAWLNPLKITGRFLTAPFVKRNIYNSPKI